MSYACCEFKYSEFRACAWLAISINSMLHFALGKYIFSFVFLRECMTCTRIFIDFFTQHVWLRQYGRKITTFLIVECQLAIWVLATKCRRAYGVSPVDNEKLKRQRTSKEMNIARRNVPVYIDADFRRGSRTCHFKQKLISLIITAASLYYVVFIWAACGWLALWIMLINSIKWDFHQREVLVRWNWHIHRAVVSLIRESMCWICK